MTREEIMATPAGRDLDRLVAEAMGEGTSTLTEHKWGEVSETDDGCEFRYCARCGETIWLCSRPGFHMETDPECVPIIAHYSVDPGLAMTKALEAMPKQYKCGNLGLMWNPENCGWEVFYWNPTPVYRNGEFDIVATADTVPLAICRAFLLLKECGK